MYRWGMKRNGRLCSRLFKTQKEIEWCINEALCVYYDFTGAVKPKYLRAIVWYMDVDIVKYKVEEVKDECRQCS